MRASRSTLLAATTVLAIATALACSGGGGGGSSESPTPTPTGSPLPADSCQIVWLTPDGTDPFLNDEFIVDAPIASWVTGTQTYSVNSPVGVFYDNVDSAGNIASAAVTTAGSFDLTVGNGTTIGGALTFTDSSVQTFYSLNLGTGVVGAQVTTGGTGTFTGVWSASSPPYTSGNGNITIAWQGTSLNLGALGKYARCYHATGATQMDRIRNAVVLPSRQEP